VKINFRKIKGYVHRHKASLGLVLVALLVGAGAILYSSNLINNFNPGDVIKPKPKEKTYATFTGLEIDPSVKNRRPFAVVIENSPDARPQSGYNDADVVYEALAEGGITRTLAIFSQKLRMK
jgi:hypothetical protein